MADEKPQPAPLEEESKKDTVRINLPPGLGGRPSPPPSPANNPATTRVQPAPSARSAPPTEEAKRETAVIGTPAGAAKPKKDTSRVQVTAAKPAPVEGPRPIVKLRRDEGAPQAAPPSVQAANAKAAAAAAMPYSGASGADTGMALLAIVFSLGVLGFLAWIVFG
jgi:hypothetical protein